MRDTLNCAMAAKFSDWLHRVSSGWVTLGAFVVFVLFTALVLPQQASTAERETGSTASPDTSIFYTPTQLYAIAAEYGESGRQAYVRARFTFDLIWPLVYVLFLTTALSWITNRAFATGSRWRRANLAPLLAGLFDYLENLAASLVLARYPEITPIVDWLAPLFTLLKWTVLGASFVLLVGGILLMVWRLTVKPSSGSA